MSKKEVSAVFLFIAELTGSFKAGSGNVQDKINCGSRDYVTDAFPELDLSEEEDRKDLHEVIWLERLYNELDEYFGIQNAVDKPLMRMCAMSTDSNYHTESYRWTVPIELDASALTKCY